MDMGTGVFEGQHGMLASSWASMLEFGQSDVF